MSIAFRRVLLLILAAGVSVYLSTRTVDFQVYYVGVGEFFRGIRPVYGALSGIGWPMHYRYPPLFLFIFFPLTLMPLTVAAGIWVGGKCLVLGRLLKAMGGRLSMGRRGWWIPALLAGPFVVQEFQYGNVQFYIFALVAGALLMSRTRSWTAGGMLALATSIKVWPLFFFPYLAVRRDWKVVGSATLLTAGLTLLPVFWFGVGGMGDLLSQWARQELTTQTGATEVWYPSQSLRGVLTRYLTVIDYSEVPDSQFTRELEAVGHTFVPDANYARVHVADLDPAFVVRLWLVLALAAYAGLLALARVGRRSPGWAVHGAAFTAVALLQPFTQKYALAILLWPAIVAGVVVSSWTDVPRWVRAAAWGAAALVACQPLVSGSPLQRHLQVVGLDFVAVCLLGAVMVWASLREADRDTERDIDRDPDAVDVPPAAA